MFFRLSSMAVMGWAITLGLGASCDPSQDVPCGFVDVRVDERDALTVSMSDARDAWNADCRASLLTNASLNGYDDGEEVELPFRFLVTCPSAPERFVSVSMSLPDLRTLEEGTHDLDTRATASYNDFDDDSGLADCRSRGNDDGTDAVIRVEVSQSQGAAAPFPDIIGAGFARTIRVSSVDLPTLSSPSGSGAACERTIDVTFDATFTLEQTDFAIEPDRICSDS